MQRKGRTPDGHLRQGEGRAQRAQRTGGDRIDKAGDFVDEKTGGKYAEQVDQGQAFAKEKLAEQPDGDPDRPESTPEQPV